MFIIVPRRNLANKEECRMNYYGKKSNGLLNWLDLKSRKYRALYWAMFAFLFFLTLVCIVPVVWSSLSGFKTVDEMYAVPQKFFPQKIEISKAVEAWNAVKMHKGLINTFIIIIGVIFFDIGVNGLTGFVLSKIKPRGSKFVDKLIFWSMMLPGMSMVPVYMTYVDFTPLHLNLLGTFWPLWLGAGANAFHVFLFRNAINAIPTSYFEAAKLDGCSNLGAFIRIILPLVKPTVMVLMIFTVMGQWGSYLWPMLVMPEAETVGVKLYKMTQGGAYALTMDSRLLVLTMSMLVPLCIFALFSKQIMGGLDMSGVKG